ncbi:MAG: hypothetical protein K8S55_06135 [Phycisphaerae bacterium]|nr:hypothetical protein [Phycisphaerae bacterium]
MKRIDGILVLILVVAGLAMAADRPADSAAPNSAAAESTQKSTDESARKAKPAAESTEKADKPPKAAPPSDLDYWLKQAEKTESESSQKSSQKSSEKPQAGTSPFKSPSGFLRDDALPGVIELSDGKQLPGGVYTTPDKPWIVWVAGEKRWRRIKPLAVLSITAVVDEEKMELAWRWKAMGEPEKVYTGKKYPFRRFRWKLHLIDGSYITGVIKGQPVWVETTAKTHGPFVLHERVKGKVGQTLKDAIYVKKIVISRKMMNKVIESQKKAAPPKQSPVPKNREIKAEKR